MGQTAFRGEAVATVGDLPEVGSTGPAIELVKSDLSTVTLGDFEGSKKILNIFPSVDTGICAKSVRTFNEKAGGTEGVVVINVSLDLPFAHARFCGAEGIEDVVSTSAFRSSFGEDYGVTMADGPMAGLFSRAVVILGEDNEVLYTEQVPEITQEPDYEAALEALG